MFNNFTLILITFLVIYVIYNYSLIKEGISNTFFYDNTAPIKPITDISKYVTVEDQILLIGSDAKNNIFKFQNKLYTIKDNKLILYNEDDNKINYLSIPIKVPFDSKAMKPKVKVFLDGFTYIGIVENLYYNQEYLVYEKPYENNFGENNDLYYYNLVKVLNGEYKIIYSIPPRNKITHDEYIWASHGAFQIGPLHFIN